LTVTRTLSRRAAGFTFLELLASMAIMGLLATVAIPFAETTVRRHKEHDLRQALREIRQGIDAYKEATVAGKIALRPGQSGYPPSLFELAGGVDNVLRPGTRLHFLRRVPRDPFFADASVAAVDTWGLRSFDSPPDHPRAGDDLFDVYSLSTGTGLNGVPYNQW
jgi:general secretion pathway protein G